MKQDRVNMSARNEFELWADNLLKLFSEGSDNEIDATMGAELLALIGKPLEEIDLGLKRVLDLSVHSALASDFTVGALDMFWRKIHAAHGKDLQYPDPETYLR